MKRGHLRHLGGDDLAKAYFPCGLDSFPLLTVRETLIAQTVNFHALSNHLKRLSWFFSSTTAGVYADRKKRSAIGTTGQHCTKPRILLREPDRYAFIQPTLVSFEYQSLPGFRLASSSREISSRLSH